MEFGIINVWNICLVSVMLIPNIIFALNKKNVHCKQVDISTYITILEQIGRYGCILLMIIPLYFDKMKFGFTSPEAFIIYLFANIILVTAYLFIWAIFRNEQHLWRNMSLAIIPTCIFLISGITLGHWLLVGASLIFGISHIYITYKLYVKACC